MPPESVGECGATLNLHFNLANRLSQRGIFRLRRQDFETLNEWKACIDHRAKLTCKHDEVFVREPGSKAELETFLCRIFPQGWLRLHFAYGADRPLHHAFWQRAHPF